MVFTLVLALILFFALLYVFSLRQKVVELSLSAKRQEVSGSRHYGPFKRQRSEGELLGFYDYLDEGVILVDGHHRIRGMNFKARHLLQLQNQTVQDLEDLPHTPLRQALIRMAQRVAETKELVRERVSLDDALDRQYDLTGVMHHGEIAILLLDASSLKKVVEMGRQFVANASHELKTPITIVKGFVETLYEMEDIPRAMFEGILEKILRNCDRMDNLVKNLLYLADLDSSKSLTRQECDLVMLVDSCSEALISIYQDVQIECFTSHEVIVTLGNPDMLEQALMNLLTNAVKYSLPPVRIRIKVEQLPDEIRLEISDQGEGISMEDLPRIFDRFFRVNKKREKRSSGSGLGLSIVKSIVQMHGGEIEVTSKLGEGSTFRLSLSPSVERVSPV